MKRWRSGSIYGHISNVNDSPGSIMGSSIGEEPVIQIGHAGTDWTGFAITHVEKETKYGTFALHFLYR